MPVDNHADFSPAPPAPGSGFNLGRKTIALVVRQNTDGIAEPVKSIIDFLRGLGHTVVFEAETATHLDVAGVAAMSAAEIGACCRLRHRHGRRRHHAGHRAPAGAV